MDAHVIQLPHLIGVAIDVLCRCYGDGDDRRAALEAMGYDYSRVQECVNDIVALLAKYEET